MQLLSIPDPTNYRVHIHRYAISHSTLILRLLRKDTQHRLFLIFDGVLYFSGQIRWESADFRIAPQGECLEILKHELTEEDYELATKRHPLYKLYTVKTQTREVKIVALGVSIESDDSISANVRSNLYATLDDFVRSRDLGEVILRGRYAVFEPEFSGSRMPEIMYISKDKYSRFLTESAQIKTEGHVCVPQLAIDVMTRLNFYTRVQKRVHEYLEDGVQLVWIVNPIQFKVMVYTSQTHHANILSSDDALDGQDILPGFTLPISDLFKT
jgi:Uma2 family endonuclease